MCGIFGVIGGAPVSPEHAQNALNAIRHRGPDDEGYMFLINNEAVCIGGSDTPSSVFDTDTPYHPKAHIGKNHIQPSNVILGHRRLSILDLSPFGHQPMSYLGRYWIVYNGEIYNYQELREELKSLGHHFLSQTDTEVILAAYAEWGPACLSRFNGMWGLAIYDTENNSLFLARDRFGVKPLYYWCSTSSLVFASEIKQFTFLPNWNATLNPQRAYDYLVWGVTDHSAETLFKGVFQIPPGHSALISCEDSRALQTDQQISTLNWYVPNIGHFGGSFEDASAQFRDYLFDSVKLRMRADVPVGSCLSGGLDSSSIVCIANKLLLAKCGQAQQHTFSACAELEKYDERKWIDQVVQQTGVQAHYVYPEVNGLFDLLSQLTWHQDEPFGSTSIYAQWNVFNIARKAGVVVMLDGQGADESLAGYHGFFAPYLAALIKSGRFMDFFRESEALSRIHGYGASRGLQYAMNMMLPEFIRQPLRAVLQRSHAKPDWLHAGSLGADPIDPWLRAGTKTASLREFSWSLLTASHLQMLLHWEDRNSMAHSVEARVPFLDYRLVEFVLSLPDDYKIQRGITKRVLRSSMEDILPQTIRGRTDKMGFVTPEEHWLLYTAQDKVKEKIARTVAIMDGVIQPSIFTTYDNMVSGKQKFNFLIWRIICFGEWIERFQVKAR